MFDENDLDLRKNPDVDVDDAEKRLQRFLLQYNAHYHRMYLFVKTLLPTEGHAEDILQEVSLSLWKKFDQFQPGTDFLAWAFRMIRIEILEWRRKKSRERVLFDDEFLDTIAEKVSEQSENVTTLRYDALIECVKKLSPKMKKLVQNRYFKQLEITEIAALSNRSVEAIYQQLYRLRSALRICVVDRAGKMERHAEQ